LRIGYGAALVRSEGRPTDVVQFECAVVSFFVESAGLLGVPRSVAAIYGICFASAQPIGFSDIRQRLDISAGSISQGLRFLKEVGALKGTGAGFDQRDRFEPDLELRRIVSHFIEQRLARQLDSGRGSLRHLAALIPERDGGGQELSARLKSLQTWHDKAVTALPIIKAVLKVT
jgi:HTH-type transcriptional regulator, glycine betaine synthesis regulator